MAYLPEMLENAGVLSLILLSKKHSKGIPLAKRKPKAERLEGTTPQPVRERVYVPLDDDFASRRAEPAVEELLVRLLDRSAGIRGARTPLGRQALHAGHFRSWRFS